MISFQELGRWGRLGNQLFQYAFLRSSARRLGVPFYCPPWVGEGVFQLDDAGERAQMPEGIIARYEAPAANAGFDPSALDIADGTDVGGYFQSERYFVDAAAVRAWFRFRDDAIARVRAKYQHVDFARSVGLHLRFGDKLRELHSVIAPPRYYRAALRRVRGGATRLVFSDEIDRARAWLRGLPGPFVFVDGNEPWEDLYLMTRCRDFVCSASTLSWWGAWLDPRPDKTVVAPREWLRPGYWIRSEGLRRPDWIEIRTCLPILHDYRTLRRLARLRRRLPSRNAPSSLRRSTTGASPSRR